MNSIDSCASSDGSSVSVSSALRPLASTDALTGLTIPPRKASAEVLGPSHIAHCTEVGKRAESICSSSPPPQSILRVLDDLKSMAPSAVLKHRQDVLVRVREFSSQLAQESSAVRDSCAPSIRSVLIAASDGGLHLSLLSFFYRHCPARKY